MYPSKITVHNELFYYIIVQIELFVNRINLLVIKYN
uniref:Uncharacterized protein n=1 Tax=Inoviridae sp. ctJfE44 TaxID=2825779 RepID=A0A8S5UBK4_9VIRU|nr:MAG TPA: hypothetical protein [Inoviridae sp. ctJfE44]DAX03540.1 MAG TPA: hypothetical protein [Inoviridae sp.]